jgi:hypothetical protein
MTHSNPPIDVQIAEALNKDCFCITVDKRKLHRHLDAHLAESGLPSPLSDGHKRLFAESPVFLSHLHVQKMQRLIQAVEHVVQNPAYRQTVPGQTAAGNDLGPQGVFFGYDFHLASDGPKLIEINTNAGGALLNQYLADVQQACCDEVATFFGHEPGIHSDEERLIEMFQREWRLQRGDAPLRNIVITDNDPAAQFLYPEFLLFQSLFRRHGIEATIARPEDFRFGDGSLYIDGQPVDLVYNRLTDFYLETPASAALRRAFDTGAAVITPSPHHYALYADKRNLPLLANTAQLREFGIDEESLAVLEEMVPDSVMVTAGNADRLWADRKDWFFKPTTGYGSRGTYRGAKLTRKTWDRIVQGGYIAQALVPPGERQLLLDGEKQALKMDIRCIAYQGQVQQISARLYRGQTTNLRTDGGGLATVFVAPETVCC